MYHVHDNIISRRANNGCLWQRTMITRHLSVIDWSDAASPWRNGPCGGLYARSGLPNAVREFDAVCAGNSIPLLYIITCIRSVLIFRLLEFSYFHTYHKKVISVKFSHDYSPSPPFSLSPGS